MILSEALLRDRSLFFRIVICIQNGLQPPLIAGSRGKHTAHQMEFSVGMYECMQRISFICLKRRARNKDRSRGSEADVAASFFHRICSDCSARIVSRSGCNHYRFRESEFFCNLTFQRADRLKTLKQLRHLFFCNTAEFQHLSAPALVRHIQQQHAGGI